MVYHDDCLCVGVCVGVGVCVCVLSDLTWLPLLGAGKMSWNIIITNRYEKDIFFGKWNFHHLHSVSSPQVSSLMELEKSHSPRRPLKTMDSLQRVLTDINYLLKNSQLTNIFNRRIPYELQCQIYLLYKPNGMILNQITSYELTKTISFSMFVLYKPKQITSFEFTKTISFFKMNALHKQTREILYLFKILL